MNPPLRPEVLRRRLQRLDEALQFLERSRRYTLEEFLADPERYGAAERFLQVAIEAADDCAAHIVAALALGPVETARDLPRLLAEHGFLEPELAQRWMRAIGFRNVLVHEYLEVDRQLVWRYLQDHLDDLRAIAAALARFLAP